MRHTQTHVPNGALSCHHPLVQTPCGLCQLERYWYSLLQDPSKHLREFHCPPSQGLCHLSNLSDQSPHDPRSKVCPISSAENPALSSSTPSPIYCFFQKPGSQASLINSFLSKSSLWASSAYFASQSETQIFFFSLHSYINNPSSCLRLNGVGEENVYKK